ncbi:Tat pathway signal sequence domain protein [Phenylobacterium sp. LjRoot219]|uniref:Tat pathway signal sequence domain protein n=1 Tax=Phenylobacterium sp. LjRoot219 TaxID=3342283 RepID=UPI003ECF67C5
MRRLLLAAAAFAMAATSLPNLAHAQGAPGGDQQDDAASKKKKSDEWGDKQAPLPAMRNAGPCPFVKTLYDAARYVEFKGAQESSSAVGFTGEIQGVSASCAYKSDDPIRVEMNLLFELGRGPQAEGSSKTFRYWVAVTDRNREVIAKQSFELPVNFPAGQDRVYKSETIEGIVIPRATPTVSGANFEVLVGFEVTPQMAAFNREGKRFRPNVAPTVASQDKSKRQ